MKVLARTLAALLAVAPAAARSAGSRPPLEPYVEHALDIALDPGSHVGKRYRVIGCLFRGVQVDEAVCEIHRGAGGPPLGQIEVDLAPDDLNGRRWLVESCASFNAPRFRCSVDLLATVGRSPTGRAVLGDAEVKRP